MIGVREQDLPTGMILFVHTKLQTWLPVKKKVRWRLTSSLHRTFIFTGSHICNLVWTNKTIPAGKARSLTLIMLISKIIKNY